MENKVTDTQEGFMSSTVSPIVSHLLSRQMLDPSVSFTRKSDTNPLTGHESKTFEIAHMGMFWQSLGADEKRKACMERSPYTAHFLSVRTACPIQINHEQKP